MKDANLETITDTQSWYKIHPMDTVIPKLLRIPKGVYESFSSHRKSRKSFILYLLCNLAKPVKNYHGIAERVVRRIKEGTSAVLFQSGLDERWWGICVVIIMCEIHDWNKPCSARIHVGFGAGHVEDVGLMTCGCEHKQGKSASDDLME